MGSASAVGPPRHTMNEHIVEVIAALPFAAQATGHPLKGWPTRLGTNRKRT